ncbi:hypothetical protein BJ944DRAFT_240126 [Cunninghamella echinulata]|nr:hypothetical protein BJ944DRAFT_240126 [Cunninghamella echinulata]
MVKLPSITSLILSSIALVQCIPLEARAPPPVSDFKECYSNGISHDVSFIEVAKVCLRLSPVINCSDSTPDTIDDNIPFSVCLVKNEKNIKDAAKLAQSCIEEIKKVTCTSS